MDPVGKEDGDINNDSRKMEQTSILNRRKQSVSNCEETWSCEGRIFCVENELDFQEQVKVEGGLVSPKSPNCMMPEGWV